MLKVAIVSLRRHTSMEPFLLYDGGDNDLLRWLGTHDVGVIRHRCRLYPELERLSAETGNPAFLDHGPGVLLKVDLAELCAEHGWGCERILFCDCDVMFQSDPANDWPTLAGACFAVGPEDVPGEPELFNTGVMLIDIASMLPRAEPFRRFLAAILPEAVRISWDQHAYRIFFRRDEWRPLRDELNWKPYWGFNPAARIVHFHGPKPWMRGDIASGRIDAIHAPLAVPSFIEWCALWDAYLVEATGNG
jgi:hypothetical protein